VTEHQRNWQQSQWRRGMYLVTWRAIFAESDSGP
jgi:hypothetical protein